jgi:pyruvate carboxylase
MYPAVAKVFFFNFREQYELVDKLTTRTFLTGPKVEEEFEGTIAQGKTLHLKTLAMSEDLTRTGDRPVFF